MNIITAVLFIFIVCVVLISIALIWHWKKFMPESGKGAGIFTIYMLGLAVLIMALFTTISAL